MTVITAHKNGKDGIEPVSQEQFNADYPEIQRQYKKAVKEEALFDMFGGVIRVGDREYQVAD